MKEILVGTYRLGYRLVRLYLNPDSRNGTVSMLPEDNTVSSIYVGLKEHQWYETISVLLHEAYELALIDLNTRYGRQPSFTNEASAFMFVMTHNELSEAHDRVGAFLSECFSDFQKAFDKHKEENKKKKKKK